MRFPWAGGRHPCLDVLAETTTAVIGIESKRFEPFRSKGKTALSDAYWRPVWGDAMAGFCRVRDGLHAGTLLCRHLDAGQLVKHAFGLRTAVHRTGSTLGKRPVLLYLHAEPTTWPDSRPVPGPDVAQHRAEIRRFAELVAGDEVEFRHCSYRQLLDGWAVSETKAVTAHAQAAVMAWFGEGERGLAMSIRQMALPAGGAAGALLLPALAESVGFRGVYGALAAMCLVTTGFVWLWLREPPVTRPKGEPAARPGTGGTGLFRNGSVWRTVFGLGALCIPQIAVVTFAAVFLNDALHLGTTAISATIVAVQLGAAVARVWSGRYTDRRRNRRPFLKACALLTAAVYGALALLVAVKPTGAGHHGALMLVGVGVLVVGGIVASSWHGIAFTELATIAGITHTGAALGLGNTFAFGTYFLTPLAIPLLLDRGGWGAVWMASALAALLAFALFPKAAATR